MNLLIIGTRRYPINDRDTPMDECVILSEGFWRQSTNFLINQSEVDRMLDTEGVTIYQLTGQAIEDGWQDGSMIDPRYIIHSLEDFKYFKRTISKE